MDTRSDDEISFEELTKIIKSIRSSAPNPLDGPVGECGCTVKDGIMYLCDREKASVKAIGDEFNLRVNADTKPGNIIKIFGVPVYVTG